MKSSIIKKLGPGLIFAGAAIGVSHLVQSTRAGADFGFGLVWALLLVNICKYPFFQFGPRYAMATGETLLDGYKKLGKPVLVFYFILSMATMFTIQTAVTIVTAGIANSLFGNLISTEIWTFIILVICVAILFRGRYGVLDKLMKIIVITLTISTVLAVIIAFFNSDRSMSFEQIFPKNSFEIGFLIAFMGWMPAPLDISIWHSIWSIEKHKQDKEVDMKSSIFDFNVGYTAAIFVGLAFISLGTLIMFHNGEEFNLNAGAFANQLIEMYTATLGDWTYAIIGIAALTTMFSTTITTLDASPRAMSQTVSLLFKKKSMAHSYLFWLLILTIGTLFIFFFLKSEMSVLITIATVLSFLTAPFYAISNYLLISGKNTPKTYRPSKALHFLSWLGIVFLVGFCGYYIFTL